MGESFKMTKGDPRQLGQRLEATLREQHEEAVCAAVVRRAGCSEEERRRVEAYGIDFVAVRRALRSKKTQGRSRHIISQLAANTYPVGRRLQKMGVRTTGVCPCCQEGEDTVRHRVWWCPALEEARERHFTPGMISWARGGGDTTLLGTMCLPANNMNYEAATLDTTQEWQFRGEDGKLVRATTEEELCQRCDIDQVFLKQHGDLYMDGSCGWPAHAKAARAGWALAQVDEEGLLLASGQ